MEHLCWNMHDHVCMMHDHVMHHEGWEAAGIAWK